MATASYCGYDGSVSGATGATEITSWKISRIQDTNDATSMSPTATADLGWKEFLPCLQDFSGSFACVGHECAVGPYSGVFKTKSSGGVTITGAIIVTKMAADSSVSGLVTYNHDFVFTGNAVIS